MSFILYEPRDSFAIVRLNRPEKLNALSREMLLELGDTFSQISERDLRAVILTGAGEQAFSVGTDISELAGLDESGAREASDRGQAICNQIEKSEVPVIAAINGLAIGGGCELALACHLRVASWTARFSLPEAKLGVIPGYGGTQRMPREMGCSRALEMMLAGRDLSADEACQIGLVNRVADSCEFIAGGRVDCW